MIRQRIPLHAPNGSYRPPMTTNDGGDSSSTALETASKTSVMPVIRIKRPRTLRLLAAGLVVGLVVLYKVVLLPLLWLYETYRDETQVSPFFSKTLQDVIRGVPPPNPSAKNSKTTFVFPSADQRIRYYMGEWFYPNSTANLNVTALCDDIHYWYPGDPEQGRPYLWKGTADMRRLESQLGWPWRLPWRYQRCHAHDAMVYHMDLDNGVRALAAANERSKHLPRPSSPSPPSSLQTLRASDRGTSNRDEDLLLALFQFGDGKDSATFLSTPYPIMVKTRLAAGTYHTLFGQPSQPHHHPPILSMMEIYRHYSDHFQQVDDLWDVIPWNAKKEALIWRGASSGRRKDIVPKLFDLLDQQKSTSHLEIDVAFSYILKVHQAKLGTDHCVRPTLSVPELLRYKYLLVLEGWGMASSLKWMLYSNSLVFMAPPTKVSWAMEDRLVPWVHYVPIQDVQGYTDLPEKVQWAVDHDDECQRIVLQSRDYMERLVTSRQAQVDTLYILTEMRTIYQRNFESLLKECPQTGKNF